MVDMNSLVLIKLAQVLTLRDKLLLDWFAILMLLVLSFFFQFQQPEKSNRESEIDAEAPSRVASM